MADVPDNNSPQSAADDAMREAQQAADDASKAINASPGADAEAAAALAAAMAAVAQATGAVSAAAKPAPAPPPAPRPAPAAAKPDAAAAAPFSLSDLAASLQSGKKETLDLLSDVQLHVKIELGRTRMYVEDVLQLADGAVVELDKLAGDPVDVFVNDRHVARGEVLVLNDNFCVRINEILDPGAEKSA